jgi:hypothetical protein
LAVVQQAFGLNEMTAKSTTVNAASMGMHELRPKTITQLIQLN